jgi:hypothetical protein
MNIITYYLVHSYNFKSWEPPVAYKAKLKLHVFFFSCVKQQHMELKHDNMDQLIGGR